MTRRNLSDILRQEVQKDVSGEALGADLKEAKSRVTMSDKKTAVATTASRARKSTAVDSVKENHTAEEDQAAAQLSELKAALSQGADHEKELQAQVKALQADIALQHKEVSRLEKQAAQSSQLKAELAEAKEVILQLSEENTQMKKTLDELKAPKAQSNPSKWKGALAVKPLPPHSVQHRESGNSAAKQSKSVDIGWMD
jgi:predicted RNase H-like nuclease (RuvC/YqgF family)